MKEHFKTALMLSYICIASASAAIITPALPSIQSVFNLNHGSLEWVVSLFLFGYVIGQIPYGPLANRFGRVRALQLGLVINCIGIVLCIFAASTLCYSLLLLGRVITALGAASGLSCTFMLINESLSPDQAKRAMSFAIVSFTLGIGLAVSIGGIVTQYLDWSYCFWVLLAHGCIMLYLTKYFQETLKTPHKLFFLNTIRELCIVAKNRQLVVFSLMVGFVSAFAYCYSTVAPVFANQVLHLNPAEYGYWNLINMIGMLGSGFLGAYLIKNHGPKAVIKIGIIAIMPIFIILISISLLQINNAILLFLTTSLFYLFSGILFPAASFFASNAVQDKANASSAMSFINMGSAMISVIVLGYLPFSSITSMVIVLGGFFLCAVLLASPYLLGKK